MFRERGGLNSGWKVSKVWVFKGLETLENGAE